MTGLDKACVLVYLLIGCLIFELLIRSKDVGKLQHRAVMLPLMVVLWLPFLIGGWILLRKKSK